MINRTAAPNMTIPFLDLSRPWLRLWCAFLCLMLPLILGIGLLQKDYEKQLQEASALQAARILRLMEEMIEQADTTNQGVISLLDRPCATATLDLSKTAALASFVRSISLAHDGKFYCSSIFGALEWVDNITTFEQGKLALVSGNPVSPNHPFLSVRKVVRSGEIVTVIDSDYLTYLLTFTSSAAVSWLRVGDNWLDRDGRFHHGYELPLSPYLGIARSAEYPISVYSLYAPAPGLWPIWHSQRAGVIVLITFSLLFSAIMWWLLGRPRSPIGELARAIRAQEFVPFLQPLVDARTQQVRGAEVLMRWRHPSVGMINPDLFIPQAEASGLIMPMTEQLMQKVASALSQQIEEIPDGFYISFNISSACCKDLTLLNACREFLAPFPPGKIQLSLELTERETLTNDIPTLSLFEQLDALGVKLAIDDFGTGHSSLVYLQQFRVDTLKIDQSFVQRIGTEHLSRHIVDNVIDLGVRLGIRLIAEGVETAPQAAYLCDKGVDMLQGYLFGRPIPIEQFIQSMLARQEQEALFAVEAST